MYRISLRVSPGMMNAQICHSQTGAEIRRPIANDDPQPQVESAGDGVEVQLDVSCRRASSAI